MIENKQLDRLFNLPLSFSHRRVCMEFHSKRTDPALAKPWCLLMNVDACVSIIVKVRDRFECLFSRTLL